MSNPRAFILAGLIAWPGSVWAQEDQDAPLSAIDWLNDVPSEQGLGQDAALALEAPVADGVVLPDVVALPLEGSDVGLVTEAASGLPATLWAGSDLSALQTAFNALPDEALAPVSALRKRLLLASAAAPTGARAEDFLELRVAILTDLGAASEALALLEEMQPLSAKNFAAYAELSLITTTEERACQRLRAEPSLSDDLALRVFCLARGSDWNAAAVTLQTGEILGAISSDKAELLAQFLEPELVSEEPGALPPAGVTPLVLRLREAIGYPLSTIGLPRIYAQGDLRPEMGWKAQLDAAERLARTGAVSANQLLGLYTSRQPAASGGVWDRAEAVQRVSAALEAGVPRDIERALPDALRIMKDANLAPALAAMVADRLDPGMGLSRQASAARDELLLLSERYEDVTAPMPTLLSSLAQGDVGDLAGRTPLEIAVIEGFLLAPPEPQAEALGLRILGSLAGIEAARQGDLSTLPAALATLRGLGLESTARQSALHLLLLT